MSTIVVVRKGDRAAIASDSLYTQGSIKVSPVNKANHHKIHRFKDAYIALTGWSVFHDIFDAVMERYPEDLDFRSRKHIYETFHKLHRRLKEDFFLETNEDKDQPVESSQWDCLIAAPSGIFEVSSNRGVYEYNAFWANGSGMRFALGAMHAAYESVSTAEEVVRAGLLAGAEFDDGTGLPVEIRVIDLAK